ncbi:MAG: hypothetical protein BMS9Abin33_0979 [Gammaproteobacteria bacterium]|nr:MAG: hypothetical protein BMS9Abin33_0979 [Gammaproteobacteria bacterium]
MLVKDIMNADVNTVTANTNIHDAAITMCFNKISGLPVVDKDNALIGIISEKDILNAMYPNVGELADDSRIDFEQLENDYRDIITSKVKDLMQTNVVAVTPDMPALKAASVMFQRRIRRIPVAVDNKVVGIISIGDVHKAIFQQHLNIQLRTVQERKLAGSRYAPARL